MISTYKIKPAFQKLLLPLCEFLHKRKVSANQVTLGSIFFSFVLGLALLFHKSYPIVILLVPVGLLLRMVLNALDGMLAKNYNQQTKTGEILNEIGDVISDLAIYISLVTLSNDAYLSILPFCFLSIINEFSGVLAKAVSGERRYDGPMGKSDRALTVGLFCILLFCYPNGVFLTHWVFGFASVLIVVSSIVRLKKTVSC